MFKASVNDEVQISHSEDMHTVAEADLYGTPPGAF